MEETAQRRKEAYGTRLKNGAPALLTLMDGIDASVAAVEKIVVTLVLGVIILVGFMGVAYRYFFLSNIVWADELIRNLVLWITFLGASLATRQGRHLKIDIFPLLLRGKAKKVLEIVLNLSACLICIFLLQTAWSFVSAERQLGEMLYFLRVPLWIVVLIVPFELAVILFRFGLNAAKSIMNLLESEPA